MTYARYFRNRYSVEKQQTKPNQTKQKSGGSQEPPL